jgi:probable HAF family extracellular repeat protein
MAIFFHAETIIMTPRFALSKLFASVLASVFLLSGCADRLLQPDAALLNKGRGGGGNPSVASVDPAYGSQGEANKAVRVIGSGFDPGSRAIWERNGEPDPMITTDSTRYVSSGELVAFITIAPDADLDLYDVAVTTSSGKRGFGMEMFEVTTAASIGSLGGNTNSAAINEAGQVVGYSMMGSVQHAFVWDVGTGMVALSPGNARGIAENGLLIVGTSNSTPVFWTRAPDGTWPVAQAIPGASHGGRATGLASDEAGSALFASGEVTEPAGRNKTTRYAALWTKNGSSWTVPQRLPTPNGFSSWANDVNTSGQAVGAIQSNSGNTSPGAAVWELINGFYQRTDLAPLPGTSNSIAHGISNAGNIVVGSSGGLPSYWRKENGVWGAAQPLAAGNGSCGEQYARDVNDAGWIVGRVCSGSAFMASLWPGPGAPRQELGGLGYGRDNSAAHAINNSSMAAGHATGAGNKRDGVIWHFDE